MGPNCKVSLHLAGHVENRRFSSIPKMQRHFRYKVLSAHFVRKSKRFQSDLKGFLKIISIIYLYKFDKIPIIMKKRVIGMNSGKNMLIMLSVLVLLMLSSCSRAECKTTADCLSKTCSVARCDEGKCIYSEQKNCCGNSLQETFEDGKPGDKCTCPQDYGKCEGIPKVRISGREQDATYARYHCNQYNRCVLGAESKDVSVQTFLDTINSDYFEASSIVKYNKPFDMKNDAFDMKITIDDANENLVMPVAFTGVKLLYTGVSSRSEQLIAETEVSASISRVGDSVTINFPLNVGYRPEEVEEAGSFRYVLDYSYTKKVQTGRSQDGSPIYEEQFTRQKFNSPAKQVFFI